MEVDGTRGIRISVKQISEAPDWLKSFCVCLGHKICFIVCLYICLEYIFETFLAYVLKEWFFLNINIFIMQICLRKLQILKYDN